MNRRDFLGGAISVAHSEWIKLRHQRRSRIIGARCEAYGFGIADFSIRGA